MKKIIDYSTHSSDSSYESHLTSIDRLATSIISPTRTFSNPMTGRISDESSSEANVNSQNIQQGIHFAIELEECQTSSLLKFSRN